MNRCQLCGRPVRTPMTTMGREFCSYACAFAWQTIVECQDELRRKKASAVRSLAELLWRRVAGMTPETVESLFNVLNMRLAALHEAERLRIEAERAAAEARARAEEKKAKKLVNMGIPPKLAKCQHCGAEFDSRYRYNGSFSPGAKRKYCSIECQQAAKAIRNAEQNAHKIRAVNGHGRSGAAAMNPGAYAFEYDPWQNGQLPESVTRNALWG